MADIANWTIMMYIAADDMLAPFAVESLKQLKGVASKDVIVAAQFDADGKRNIPCMVFDGTGDKTGSLEANVKFSIPQDTDMADPCTLTEFIDWAYTAYPARHYCLVMWGHGPELLFDEYAGPGPLIKRQKFLSPSDLRKALADSKLIKADPPGKFDIVGIDACNMSMIELACELRDYAKFLVVSQEEVPDFSFPYDSLLQDFGQYDSEVQIAGACQEIPNRYISAYEDFILTRQTQMKSITLTSIDLDNVANVTRPLDQLATALLASIHDEKKRQAVIDARANCKGFVAGLYTDLYDFCEQLKSQFCCEGIDDKALIDACDKIRAAIIARGDDACIIANDTSEDKHCHGLSVYFPYMTDADWVGLAAPLAPMIKGGSNVPNKGTMDVPNKGTMDVPNKNALTVINSGGVEVLREVREQRIQETELYYDGLLLCRQTAWGEFIKHGWSRWLTEDAAVKVKTLPSQQVSDVLDARYSAQQIALNLLSLCQKMETGTPATAPVAATTSP